MRNSLLHVIAPISNPVRFQTRYRLFREFAAQMREAGVQLHVVELAQGDRPFEVSAPQDVQLRTFDELWHKENLINIAISRLPSDWEYVAWIDTDITFMRKDWAAETVQQLQHHHVVQLFQTAVDTGPSGEALNMFHGFAWCYTQGITPQNIKMSYPYGISRNGIYLHPGFGWAARREAVDGLGGLLDRAILGAADHHMAMSFAGIGRNSVPKDVNKNYLDYVMRWQYQAEKFVRRDIGYVPGTILHNWHGKKRDRKYWSRWEIIKKSNFDPTKDIKRDWQGLYQLVDHGDPKSIVLRDGIRRYFRGRHEDSIDP